MTRSLMALALTLSTATSLLAQTRVPQVPSLGLAPSDAAFFSVSLRGKEQWDRLRNSNAVKKLLTSSFLQLALDQVKQQFNNEPGLEELRRQLDQPENQELVKVIADGLSQEVFLYGDESLAGTLQILNRFNGAMRAAQFEMAAQGGDEQILMLRILQFVVDNQASIQVPEIVLGMKVSDKAAAQRQVDRLEQLIPLLNDTPLSGAAKKEQIGSANMFTLNVKGDMLPIDEMRRELEGELDSDEGKETAEKLIQLIRSRTVSVAVGLWNDYLLFSMGPTSHHIAQFGQGQSLARHPKIRPLGKHINKKLVSVGYASEEFLKAASSTQEQLDDLAKMVEAGTTLAPIPDNIKKALTDDAKRFSKDLGAMVPEPGAMTAFSYMTDEGYEGYAYSWSESFADASKPLSILEHVGGDPILFAAGRATQRPPNQEARKYWSGRLDFYVTNLVMPNLPPEQQTIAKKLLEKVKPILAQASTINDTLLGPALKDGQSAFVLDGKLLSAQPHRSMPRPEKQLPLPELAIVLGVADQPKLAQAVDGYFRLGDEIIDAARTVFEQIPPFTVPRAIPQTINNNTIYTYPIALLLGLDGSIGPNGAAGNGVAVVSLTPETSSRLITGGPLQSAHVMQYANQPLAGAFSLNFPALIDVVHAWAEYGVEIENAGDESLDLIKSEMDLFGSVLGCFRQLSGVSFREGDATVTHTQSVFKDLED